MTEPFETRYIIDPETQCHMWQRAKTTPGYGVMRIAGHNRPAHRVAYERKIGPIPPGLELDHLCRNRACVNPAHLEPVTHQENVRRGTGIAAIHAKKTHCPKGHPYSGDNLRINVTTNGRLCLTCIRAYRHSPQRLANQREWRKQRAANGLQVR